MDYLGYLPPLKEDVDFLHYDLGVWSEIILNLVGNNFPNDLLYLKERLESYSEAKSKNKPKEFGDYARIYIIDNRLKLHFLCKDQTSKMDRQCYEFVKHRVQLEDDLFGSKDLFNQSFLEFEQYQQKPLNTFIDQYDFAPIDELNMNWLLIFEDDELVSRHKISPWAISFLLLKYRNKNLVDWNRMIKHPFNIY